MSIQYILCGFVFCLLPAIRFAFKFERDVWSLPLKAKIFFIDDQSHPGYEVHYLFCVHYTNYLCVGLVGWFESSLKYSI